MSLSMPPQYEKETCWALRQPAEGSKFDVFYVYPTFYNGAAESVMDIYKTRLLGILKSNITKNTGIFKNASVYSPLYRQASFKTLFLSDEKCNQVLTTPYADILNAFDYFDKYISCGRPFVLAGHSQGARMLANLLKLKFNSAQLRRRLISAYLIGYCLTQQEVADCPWLVPAAKDDDTGVIITYNTQSPNVEKTPIYTGRAVCINPLNWSAASMQLAPRENNKGAVFFDRYGNPVQTINAFTSAYIDKNGFLITPDADENIYSSGIFAKGIFHVYDYDFFFTNLQQNAALRICKYFHSSVLGQ